MVYYFKFSNRKIENKGVTNKVNNEHIFNGLCVINKYNFINHKNKYIKIQIIIVTMQSVLD